MKIALFTPCYLDGSDAPGSDRLERNFRYVYWYSKIQRDLGFENIILADNGSSPERRKNFERSTVGLARVDHFTEQLKRGAGRDEYPYCWRAVWHIRSLIAEGYQKIIFCDSDCFILTHAMAHRIFRMNSGWTTFWSEKYQFPLAEIQVICQDAFPRFLEFTDQPWAQFVGQQMERVLPFTEVIRGVRGDRFGEDRLPHEDGMQFYSQAPTDIELRYRCNL